jgi:hypothetical protein
LAAELVPTQTTSVFWEVSLTGVATSLLNKCSAALGHASRLAILWLLLLLHLHPQIHIAAFVLTALLLIVYLAFMWRPFLKVWLQG